MVQFHLWPLRYSQPSSGSCASSCTHQVVDTDATSAATDWSRGATTVRSTSAEPRIRQSTTLPLIGCFSKVKLSLNNQILDL